jgi:hypothetical protein
LRVPSPTEEFFARLAERGYEPLLRRMDHTVRIDLSEDVRTEHWRLEVRRGNLRVSRGRGDADSVMITTRQIFDEIVTGETKPMAAWLRNQIAVEGVLFPLLILDRLLPSPPGSHDPRELAAPLVADAGRSVGWRAP